LGVAEDTKVNLKDLEKLQQKVEKPFFLFRRWVIISSASVLTLGLGTGTGFISHDLSEKDTILPGVSVAGIELGRINQAEANQKVTAAVEQYLAEPFVFTSTETDAAGNPVTFEASAEELGLQVDVQKSVAEAFAVGHRDNPLFNLGDQVASAFGGYDLALAAHFDPDLLEAHFDTAFLEIEEPAKDAHLKYEKGQLKEVGAEAGREIIREPAIQALQKMAPHLRHETVALQLGTTSPAITMSNLGTTRVLAEKMMASKLNLYYQDKNFSPSADVIGSWLEFHTATAENVIKNEVDVPSLLVTPFDQKRRGEKETDPYYVLLPLENFTKQAEAEHIPVVGINRNELNHWLLENVSAGIDVPGENARLAFKDGKITVTQPSKSGIGVDIEKAAHDIVVSVLGKDPTVKLVLKEAKPQVTEDRINELGIQTLIGKAATDYSGSPPNRMENIRVGLAKLDGMVIAPDEEFSIVEAITPVDAASGYLPELVITGNKIRPEYGGGLCQVATTLYRTVLDTGMDVTERTNHAFFVHYYLAPYAVPGVEATLYDPAPDLKFINDTEAHILIHAYITDDLQAVVEFYGTDPGRTTTIDGPYQVSGSPVGGGTTVFTYTVVEDATGKVLQDEEVTSIFQPLAKFKRTN
jgi:vancomycin resistance protein YoaR